LERGRTSRAKRSSQGVVCDATVVTPAGRFRGLGDASLRNSRDPDAGAPLRLAEARAQARALCEALNLAPVPMEDAPG
jgi:hypothetical protein